MARSPSTAEVSWSSRRCTVRCGLTATAAAMPPSSTATLKHADRDGGCGEPTTFSVNSAVERNGNDDPAPHAT